LFWLWLQSEGYLKNHFQVAFLSLRH